MAAMGLAQGGQVTPEFAKARGTAYKVLEIINKKSEIEIDGEGIKGVNLVGEVCFENVQFSYPKRKKDGDFSDKNFAKKGEKKEAEEKLLDSEHKQEIQQDEIQILKGISFEVRKGQMVALVGPSGCGNHSFKQFLECLLFLIFPLKRKIELKKKRSEN